MYKNMILNPQIGSRDGLKHSLPERGLEGVGGQEGMFYFHSLQWGQCQE